MKKSITKNYVYNLIYQILLIIIPIITIPYISRILGAENIGIYNYTLSISAYFILFGSLGVSLYGQREIAYNQKDKYQYSKIFLELFILKSITMIISIILFYFAFVYNENNYNIYFKILILELIGNIFDISWFFQGLEEFKKTVTRNIFVKIIGLICIFVFIKTKEDLSKYFMIYVLSIFIANISLWIYIPRYIQKIEIKKINLFRHLKPTLILFIPQIAIQVYTILDKTMIGMIISNKSEVGFYSQSEKIIKLALTIITSLGIAMMPRIASIYAEGNRKKINEYLEKSFNFVMILSFPMIFGIAAVSQIFVPVFFGNGYEKVVILMIILSPIIFFIGLSNVIGQQYLLPTQRQKEYTSSVIIGAGVNFFVNMLLIPKFGAVGAAIGTIIAEFMVTIIQIICTRKDFNYKNIIFNSKNYIVSSIAMFVTCKIFSEILTSNLISLILLIVIGTSVYFICLIVLKDRFLKENLSKIKSLIEKFKLNYLVK